LIIKIVVGIIAFLILLVVVIKITTQKKDDFDNRLSNIGSFWKKCCSKLKGKEYGI